MNYFENISSWQDLHALLQTRSNKEKGDCFELLTKYALQLVPKYRSMLKNVWLNHELSYSKREYLNQAIIDIGTDIIAETHTGEYWAIQCKYHGNEDRKLTHSELSTFFADAFVRSKHFSFGLVCSNANAPSKYYDDVDNIGFACNDFYTALDNDFFENIRRDLQGKAPKPPEPKSPRPHQIRAIENGIKHFQTDGNERGKLIAACGSGKSLTGYWLAEELNAQITLVCVPSLYLLNDALETWSKESMATKNFKDWICVCSDSSIGKSDDVAFYTKDLGVPVKTDVDEISKLLKEGSNKKVVFTTYQSGEAIATASKLCGITFDLAIFDEAHKTVGRKDKLFSKLLFEENINIRQRIFMTATERQFKGQSDEILSMDDFSIYGDTFDLLSFKEALECTPPILSDYKIITISVSEEEIEELINANAYVKPDKGTWTDDVEARTLASLIGLRKAMTKYPIKHAVSFHGSISKAKAFRDSQSFITSSFPHLTPIEQYHVTGAVPTSERKKIVEEFTEAEHALITNAKCLTEGVDVPKIDCVLFADPKRSTVDIVQAVGRALRRFEGKEFGYVILPFIVKGDDLEDQESPFSDVINVLARLASNDERIIEYFRAIANGKKANEGIVKFDIDEQLADKIDISKLTKNLELQIWNKLAKISWMSFEEARKFARQLRLNNFKEWQEYSKSKDRPRDIPSAPTVIYKNDGWQGSGDWLGTGIIANQDKEFRLFNEARIFVHKLKLKNYGEWLEYGKSRNKPDDIPQKPERTYKGKGWDGWGDWLGTGNIANKNIRYKDFEEARGFVRKLGLKSQKEWLEYGESGNKPDDIPQKPKRTYKGKGWIGIPDWLGTGNVANKDKEFRSFNEARSFVHNLKLKNNNEWLEYCKNGNKPNDLPSNPNKKYLNKGWIGVGDWLGTGNVANKNIDFRTFEEARGFVRKLGLKSQKEWLEYGESGNKPDDIPQKPERTYKGKGWQGIGDWLGTGNIANQNRKYMSFIEARKFARKLSLKSRKEWIEYCNSDNKPDDIPVSPVQVYKNKGWKGISDWLGKGD
jgi:superfamily II DNA or RNA helicase